MKSQGAQIITTNRKATHEYFIAERLECGIVLQGTEVKSLRAGRANLKDSYCKIKDDEAYLLKCHITPYEHGGYVNHEPERPRKLLLHRNEIKRLLRQVESKGITLIPLKMYFIDKGIVKVEIGLAKGKRQYDKRAALAAKDNRRERERIRKDSY